MDAATLKALIEVGENIFEDIDLSEADLSRICLNVITFKRVNFTKTQFCQAVLHNVVFDNCQLKATNFMESTMMEINFVSSTLNDTIFDKSYLFSVIFENCALLRVRFNNSRLDYTKFDPQCQLSASQWEGVQLANSVYFGCDISDIDFTQTTVPTTSHTIIAAILKQRAETRQQLDIVQFIRDSTDLCWPDFAQMTTVIPLDIRRWIWLTLSKWPNLREKMVAVMTDKERQIFGIDDPIH